MTRPDAMEPPDAIDVADDIDRPTYSVAFWVGLALGLPLIAYGLRGAVDELAGVELTSFVSYFLGGAVVHDVAVAPAICVIGWLVVRFLPRPAVAPVQVALVASAVVGLVAWPLVRGYGITPGEPSFLSRNYAASVLTIWAVLCTVTMVAVIVRMFNARRR